MSNMDNRRFDVNGHKDDELRLALRAVFAQSGGTQAVSWKVVDYCTQKRSVQVGYPATEAHGTVQPDITVPCLVLLPWRQDGDVPFPFGMGAESVVPSVNGWLFDYCIMGNRYSPQPDHDGSNSQGWRVFIDDWGRVQGLHAICGIRPEWCWHGK
jgi:hypothetical protein